MDRTLTPQDHEALCDRIKAAEATTRGEIYCVVARASDGYFFPAAFMLAVGVMLASIAVGAWLDRDWQVVGHLGFALCQAAALAAALVVLRLVPSPSASPRAPCAIAAPTTTPCASSSPTTST
jgi:putative membrane protein